MRCTNGRQISWVVLVAVLSVGCGGIYVRPRNPVDLFDDWRVSLGVGGKLSPRTEQTLRNLALAGLYQHDPEGACVRLHQIAVEDPQPDLLFALAEIHYQRGQITDRTPSALDHYYLCAGYAYHYLFATADQDRPGSLVPADTFDPRFRLACSLYNSSLAKCLTAAQRSGRLDPRQELRLPTPDGRGFRLSVCHIGFAWPAEEFGSLRLCEDFEVVGLANQYHTYGLGVPLLGSRARGSPPAPGGAHYPRQVSFPVTAFFRFDGTLADLGSCRCGQLELYDPLAIQAIEVRGRRVPLETDLTTPLAHALAHTGQDVLPYAAFLDPDHFAGKTGLYLAEPYQPGKIPVVFVHGLLSSPLTWAPLYNDLRADPVLRSRYQFWFFFYPTSSPYLASAADLRQDLARLRQAVDPNGQDAALGQMVLVGHSMGGLIAHLLTVQGGDDFWALAADRPLAQLKTLESTRQELERVFYFQRDPGVRRVVFLATPHQGSTLSPSFAGRLGDHLARLPQRLINYTQDLDSENPDVRVALRSTDLPTSIDLLAPEAPALELLAARPRPEGVHYHSVVGVLPHGPGWLGRLLGGPEVGDGVVPYASAHLGSVDSEVIVPQYHTEVHHHALAVQEVRRILHEHLASLPTDFVVPVRAVVGDHP